MAAKSILNHPPKILPGPQLLHDLVNWTEHGKSCAIDFSSNGKRIQYSYAEVKSCSSFLASKIRRALIQPPAQADQQRPQHIVPLLLPQCPGLYISQLATLESGGAFCPINLDAPQERIKFVVGDISAKIIITTSEFKDMVSWENGPQVIIVDEFPTLVGKDFSEDDSSFDATTTDLAYVMYTSGSSGTPKGVAISNLAVVQSLLAHQKHIPHFKRFLQFAAPSFDVSVFEIFFPLIRGSTLVGCDRHQLLNDLPGMITSLNIDAAELTPTVAGSLLQKRVNAPCLRLLLTIGEMLTKPIVEEFGGSETRKSMLYGMYGPTEAAIHCNINPAMPSNSKPGNVGIPLDTVSNFVAVAATSTEDAQSLDFLPIGEIGELILGGPQLARGYLNRDEQNKAAFVQFRGDFYYRTGDKAKILEDGSVEIHGRISAGQVKLRGQRVELGEIEEAVFKHAGISTVVASVIGSVLVVFALAEDETITLGDIINTCSKWLPKFMVPSEIVLLKRFPYLASGKVDKRRLETDYQHERKENENKSSSSMTGIEKTVKDVLKEVLGPFSNNMRLGAAGLDSLQSIRVSSMLRKLGFNIPTLTILQSDTLQSLARVCEKSKLGPTSSQYQKVLLPTKTTLDNYRASEGIEENLPCTPLQSAMLAQTLIDQKAYHNWVELEILGITDSIRIVDSFFSLADHNPILRTGFVESHDSHGYIQEVLKSFPKSQIEEVKRFNYDFDETKDSLKRPVRIQLLPGASSTKLLLHLHHALYDAWSLELLLDDLNTLLLSNEPPRRPSFGNLVSAYQDGSILPTDHSAQEYWEDHLAHLDSRVLRNFHSGERPSPSLSIARLQTSISTSSVEFKAKQLSSSSQSLFQAAYSVILGSYLGSSDVCFGTVFSGRTLPVFGIEDIAGPCLSTLPVRVDYSTITTFGDLVKNINATNRKHMNFSVLPLRDIKLAASVHGRQQIFDTLLIWQQTLHGPDQKREHVHLIDAVDNLEFNLTFEIIPGVDNIEFKANYQCSIFPSSQIQFFLSQMQSLVQLILDDETTTLSHAFDKLPLHVLSIENEHRETKLGLHTLSSPVESIALEDPDRSAIEFATSISSEEVDLHRMTYGELNSRANQVANYLLGEKVLPDQLLCICMEKCVDFYTSILAVSKAGAGYLPITPDVPSERLQHILKEAKICTIITHSSSYSLFASTHNLNVLQIDKINFENLSSKNILLKFSPADISYCVFTSGSTGTPKGVLVTQGNLLSNLDALEEIYPTSKNSRFLQSCSQSFDVSVFEIFYTWRVGGCICSATKDVLFRDIEQAIRMLNVSHLSLTPTVAALVNPSHVPKVQFLVTAGEAVTQKVFNSWSGRGLYQGYGPSETTNICTVNPKVSPFDSINNIGRPFTNTSAFVLQPGPEFSLVPRGGEGEFCFGGSQVFRGYLNKDQEIGKIFNHPQYGRLYRSGDFGRLMPDGTLAFTGRQDDQVKIRGQRVELGEINNVMLKSTEVADCITMVIEADGDKQASLVCFWAPTIEQSGSFETLQPDSSIIAKLFHALEITLPTYMIPTGLIPVSQLPSTPQGKIDRRLLTKKYRTLHTEYLNLTSKYFKDSSDHSWTDLESQIAKTLSEITRVALRDVGPGTSFFSLGIDSISAISLASKLRNSTERQIEISDVLKYSSVIRLAERLQSMSPLVADILEHSDQSPEMNSDDFFEQAFLVSIAEKFNEVGKEISKILPCTPLQEAMLSAAESSNQSLYCNKVVFEVLGDMEKLRRCWVEMVQRHEVLRTCFIGTELIQHPYAQVILKHHELQFAERDISKPFELEPPYSIQMSDLDGSAKIIVSMHHALYDAVALEVLYAEVETLYRGESLPPVLSLTPFLQHIMRDFTAESDKFWMETMEDVLPSKVQASLSQSSSERKYDSHSLVQKTIISRPYNWVEKNLKKHNTSMLAVCHAVWSSILSAQLRNSDVCFGNVVSGRTISIDGIERLVAPCFNTIPVRLSNTVNTSYLEAFRKFQSLNADSLQFQFTPLRRIQSKFSADGSRLFDTLFILQQPPKELDSTIWNIKEDDGMMDFPLVCEVIPRPKNDSVEVIFHYDSFMFSEEKVSNILSSFEESFNAALENPRRQMLSQKIKDFIAEKEQSRQQVQSVLSKASPPREMIPLEKTLQSIIADFTDVTQENIGVDMSIFRLGLDSISTVQVATRLRKQGFEISGSDILENPTIAELATHLSHGSTTRSNRPKFDFEAFDQRYRASVCANNHLNPEDIAAIRPCTPIQNGMIAQTLHSDGNEYFNSMWLELLQTTSLSIFKAAWNAVCANHEMLRTGFAQLGDPQYPFAMMTYHQDKIVLPRIDDTNSPSRWNGTAKDLLLPPWGLRFLEKDGKHVVQFDIHHALYDANSMQIILLDLSKICSGKGAIGFNSIEPMLGATLHASEADQQSKQEFWQREENKIIVNRFPDLTPLRLSEDSTNTCQIFSNASTAELEQSCRKVGVTMQAAAQATWAKILASYTGETSTTFGITLSGRSIHEDLEEIAFPSIVTLPVRCDVLGTNSEILQRTMISNSLLHKHQFTPLTSIQKWTGNPEGKMFDTLFAYQKVLDSESEGDAPWSIIQEEASVDYAVSLEVQPTKSGRLVLRLTFKENLLPLEHSRLLLRQFDALLWDTLHYPGSSCDVAPKLGTDLISITPANQKVLPGPVNLLHEFVERGAKLWPEKVAFEFATNLEPGKFSSTTWKYEQLEQESNKIAHLLGDRGVVPGQIVGICFDKCAEASFAIVGILKAGAAYVALDPTAPIDRLKFIAQDSGAAIILTGGKPSGYIQGVIDSHIINLDDHAVYAYYKATPPVLARNITPEDISYCLYTSGTTGTPKGCLITHESAVQAMYSFQILFKNHWTSESKWLQFASFHFDVSVLEQFWSWSVGICVASAPRDLIFEDIPEAIRQLGITHIDLTPSLARLVYPNEVPSLCKGVFITGGESLKQEILDVWGEHACVYNGYGPTEATIGVTMYPRVPRNGNPANIGPQFENVGSFILKPGTSLPVLRGGVGELCVSGKLVGKGYLNRPELTAERFPILETFNERVYRTGDLVRILHDGSFIFLGRADDQVKLRGQRLELTEINEVIKKGVIEFDQVVTLVLKHETQQKEQLVTFLVIASITKDPNDEGNLIARARNACKGRLPGYMVPTHFIPIDKLPLNANNKTDSKQLAAMYNKFSVDELQRLSHASQQGKDWSDREKPIIATISKLLSVEETAITRGSNVFELGLDSISIIGFSRGLQTSGFESAKLSLVKSNRSIEGLVTALLQGDVSVQDNDDNHIDTVQRIAAFAQRHAVSICKSLGIEHSEIEAIAPCTPVQEGMIYRFLESDSPLYFNKFEFKLQEGVDLKLLLSAWGRVIKQLQIMRTRFVETDDGYAQVALRPIPGSYELFSLNYSDLSKAAALKTPFCIDIRPASLSRIMYLQIFHGLYDGNSLTMLLRYVVAEYQQLKSVDYGLPFQTSLPFGPLAQVQNAHSFWTSHLKHWSYQPIPHTQKSSRDIIVAHEINSIQKFEALRKQLGVSHQSIIQAAWVSVLQSIATSSITLGIVTSGRAIDFKGVERVIGPLFNTVPFHTTLGSTTTAKELISTCHNFNMEMQSFQHTPLKDIQRWSPAKPGESLFDILFVFQRPEKDDATFADGMWQQVDGGQEADYPVAFEATLSPDSSKLDLVIVAQGSHVSQPQAKELLARFETTLNEILQNNASNIVEGGKDTSVLRVKSNESEERALNPSTLFTWTRQAEQIRAEIATLAKVATESVHENSSIFKLGLDSIDVIKLASRLKKIGIEIPVSVIIKCQSISRMIDRVPGNSSKTTKASPGELLENMRRDLKICLENSRKFGDVEDILPATPLQQGMVNEMIRSGFKRYFNVEAFKLDDSVDLERLQHAVKRVIDQSPILRTTFTEIQDPKSSVSFAQVVHNTESEYSHSITRTRKIATDQSIQLFLDAFPSRAIKFAKKHGQILQLHFLDGGSAKYMVMAISHALYDGKSLRALHDDFSSSYRANLSSRLDYKPMLEQVFQSTTDEAKSFWRTTVSNLPSSRLPMKVASGSEKIQRLEKQSRVSLKDIEALCKSSRITLQTVGQTCWALVLAQIMGQLDVVFGSVLSCRDTEESGEVMFPLMNTVLVRSVIHGTLKELLRYMQDMSDTTRQYQHFPLGLAQAYALASQADQNTKNDAILFDTLFIYQGRRAVIVQDPLYESIFGSADVEFPVCVEMEIVDDEYLNWTAACKPTAAVEATQIVQYLEIVLEHLFSSPQSPTIQPNSEGTSICGLPRFKKVDETPRIQQTLVTPGDDSEWTTVEANIRRALHDLSGVPEDKIQKKSTIFHLGLDSILILKLPPLLREYGIHLRVSDILKEQTVASMAVAAQNSSNSQVEIIDIDSILKNATKHVNMEPYRYELERSAGPIEEILPVTAGQFFMIRQWQFSRGALFYSTFTFTIAVRINKARLDRAWRILLQRHEVLRTGFIEINSEILQVVFRAPHNDVIYQSQGSPPMRRHSLAYPPINLTLEEGKDVDAQLKLVIHHALYDGVSLPIIIEELQVLYKLERLEPPNLKFRDFVAHSLSAASKPSTKQKWTSYLQTDKQTLQIERTKTSPDRTEVFCPSNVIANLRQTAQSGGISIDALLLATIAKVRSQHIMKKQQSSSEDLIIGIYHSNRAPFGTDLSPLCAPTLSLIPLRIRDPWEKSLVEIARSLQEDLNDIVRGELPACVGLEMIYELTGVRVDFWVNILKDTERFEVDEGEEDEGGWKGIDLEVRERSEVKRGVLNEMIDVGRGEAFVPSIDVEIRYTNDGKIDLGVFAPADMLSVMEGEAVIEDFIALWN